MRASPSAALHGGKGGGPKGERNGAYQTGRYTAVAIAERRQVHMLIRGLRHPIDSGE
jgi:hypothetical protein